MANRIFRHRLFSTTLIALAAMVTTLSISSLSLAGSDITDAVDAILNIDSDRDYGEYLATECLTCHSPDGDNGAIPQIHGKDPSYLVTALLEYKSKQRENTVMQGVAAPMTNDDIAAIVKYLSEG